MEQFEYEIQSIDRGASASEICKTLLTMGQVGWELVNVNAPYGRFVYDYIFKRKVLK